MAAWDFAAYGAETTRASIGALEVQRQLYSWQVGKNVKIVFSVFFHKLFIIRFAYCKHFQQCTSFSVHSGCTGIERDTMPSAHWISLFVGKLLAITIIDHRGDYMIVNYTDWFLVVILRPSPQLKYILVVYSQHVKACLRMLVYRLHLSTG